MIEAVIFDMDGLLIDSEHLWEKAEIEVLNKVGVPLTIEMTKQTMGLKTDEVINYWYRKYPWDSPSQQTVAQELDESVIQLIKAEAVPKEGVYEAFAVCDSLNLPIAIASSSPNAMIQVVIDKLGIRDRVRAFCSAHDEKYGKPHPAVYIRTAAVLDIHPEHCLAFEDSANGVLSAKSAKMKCIAVPDSQLQFDKRFGIADKIILSLKEFSSNMINIINKS